MVGFQKEKVKEERKGDSKYCETDRAYMYVFTPKRNHSDWHFDVVASETGSKLSRIALWDSFGATIISFTGYYEVV